MVSWWVGGLVGWLVGWLAGWVVGWLFVWLFACLAGSFVCSFGGWLRMAIRCLSTVVNRDHDNHSQSRLVTQSMTLLFKAGHAVATARPRNAGVSSRAAAADPQWFRRLAVSNALGAPSWWNIAMDTGDTGSI